MNTEERGLEIGRLTGELVLALGHMDVIIRRLAEVDVTAVVTNQPQFYSCVGGYPGPIRLEMSQNSPPHDLKNPEVQ